jgi:hypothetical protein
MSRWLVVWAELAVTASYFPKKTKRNSWIAYLLVQSVHVIRSAAYKWHLYRMVWTLPQVKQTVDGSAILVLDGHCSHVCVLEVIHGGRENRMSIIRVLPSGTAKTAAFRPDILGSIELPPVRWRNRKLDTCISRLCRGFGLGSAICLGKRHWEQPSLKTSSVVCVY